MATPNMNLVLPVPTTTLGPAWASELNAALELVDAHDHTSGKGLPIPVSALNVNVDLDFSNKKLFDLFSAQFQQKTATVTGASNANSVYSVSGNLWWTNGSGNAVQITNGGSLASAPASVNSFATQAVNTNLTIGASDTFVALFVDTTAARTITLPLASAVTPGRVYIVKDISGQSETNAITIDPAGSDTIDGASSYTIDSNYASAFVVSDGVSSWSIS